jgi:hypothetical protein
MNRKPWEPGVGIPSQMVDGIPHVSSDYLHQCVEEIRRLQEELKVVCEERKTIYLTAEERSKAQMVINAAMRSMLDAIVTVKK